MNVSKSIGSGVERLDRYGAVSIRLPNLFDLHARFVQLLLAVRLQLCATRVGINGVIQSSAAGFELADNLFKLRQRLFETEAVNFGGLCRSR